MPSNLAPCANMYRCARPPFYFPQSSPSPIFRQIAAEFYIFQHCVDILVDFVKHASIMNVIGQIVEERAVAENESLDLGGSYAKRWDAAFTAVRERASCATVAREFERALYGGLRKALKQWNERGVSLSDLLHQCDSRQALQTSIRMTDGHQYMRLFESAVASSGPSRGERIRGWIDAVLDTVFDHICLRVAGQGNWQTLYDVQDFTTEVRQALEPAVRRITSQFEKDPNWQPRRVPSREREQVSPTERLMPISLLGAAKR